MRGRSNRVSRSTAKRTSGAGAYAVGEVLERRVLLAGVPAALGAAPGDVDTTFGGSGIVRVDVGASGGQGMAGAVQGDGKVLVAGAVGDDFLLARYNADGTADTSFGGGDGVVRTAFTGVNPDGSPRTTRAVAEAVAVLPGGKIVVTGTASFYNVGTGSGSSDIAVARYTAAGVLDTTFGRGGAEGDGKVLDHLGTFPGLPSESHTLAVLGDGRLLVAGAVDGEAAVVRYNADGTIDSTFGGGDGVARVVNDFGSVDYPRASSRGGSCLGLAVLPGGKILLTGTMDVYETAEEGPGDTNYILGTLDRYNADGSIDTTFGGGSGRVVHNRVAYIGNAAALPDGRVLAAAPFVWNGTSYDLAVARFNGDGSLDSTFAPGGPEGDGIAAVDFFGGDDRATALALDAAGDILVTGTAQQSSNFLDRAVVLARLLPDGRLDGRFGGGDGMAVNDLGAASLSTVGNAVFLRPGGGAPDGTAVVVGTAADAPVVARFVNTVSPPPATVFQAEQALLNGALVSRDHGGYTGTGYADYQHSAGDWVEFRVPAPTAGRYELTFRYANGGAGRTLALSANDVAVPGGVTFAPTGSWSAWKTVTAGVDLVEGLNKVRLTATGQSGPNLDALSLGALAPPPASATYQAESAARFGVAVATNPAGYTGSGFADYQHSAGDYVEFAVDAPSAGDYVLNFRYANGSASDRALELKVDGQVLGGRVSFTPTGAWTTWKASGRGVALGAGRHLVRLTSVGANGPNLDALTVTAAPPPPAEPLTVQAESATVSGAVVASGNAGFTGAGYADYVHAGGDWVEWPLTITAAGTYRLTFRYANGSATDRPLDLSVNGTVLRPQTSFAPTGGWATWKTVTVPVTLGLGTNKVRLTSIGSNGPNIDSLTVPAQPGPAPGTPDASFAGDGVVTVNLGADVGDADDEDPGDAAYDLLPLSSGGTVVAGAGGVGFQLFRLTPDGSVDVTFGDSEGNASAYFPEETWWAAATSVAALPGGKLLAAGVVDVVEHVPDGNLAGSGVTVQDFGIVEDVGVARFNADGSLDTTFGAGGVVLTDLSDSTGGSASLATLPNGQFVVGYRSQVLRYSASGALLGSRQVGGPMVALPDNKVVVATPTALTRLNADLTTDRTFGGGDGAADMAFAATDLVRLPDGRLLAAAPVTGGQLELARFNADGSPDATFGGGSGRLSTWAPSGAASAELALLPDGRMAVLTGPDFAVVYLNADGNRDMRMADFGTWELPPQASGPATANAIAVDAAGRITVAGTSGGDVLAVRLVG